MPTEYSESMGPTELVASDGRTISVEAIGTEPAEIRVKDGITDVVLPYPAAGYGGHQLALSKNERHLAVHFFSGQGDNWIELFDFQPFRHVKRVEVEQGVCSWPTFSGDGRLLAIACTVNTSLEAESYGTNDGYVVDNAVTIPWTTLQIFDIELDSAFTSEVEVLIAKGEPIEREEDFYVGSYLGVSADGVEVHMAWGPSVTVPFPPADVVVDGPVSAGGVELG